MDAGAYNFCRWQPTNRARSTAGQQFLTQNYKYEHEEARKQKEKGCESKIQ